MAMLTSPLTKCAIFLLVSSFLLLFLQSTTSNPIDYDQERPLTSDTSNVLRSSLRHRRAISKPGFFWTFGTSIFQQFNETRSAFKQIRTLLNDQFIDERSTIAPTEAPALEANATTTEAPYRISRAEFNKIIMRNLRGLARLYNLEVDLAEKQSVQNQDDFNKQLRQSVKQELS